MKRCCRCHKTKAFSEFTRNKARKDGYNQSCKTCHQQYQHKHYSENKEYYIEKAQRHNLQQRERLLELINEAKNRPCVDCGKLYDPVAMDLDHVRGEKLKAVASMRSGAYSESVVRREIAKCEVRCAVCHRLRTHGKTKSP